MTHSAYLLAAILGLTSVAAIGMAFLYLSPFPIYLWLAGFVVWLVLLFKGGTK